MTSPPEIPPPAFVRLTPAALSHFRALIASRPDGPWPDLDLVLAAFLARTFAEIERVAAELAGQSGVIENRCGSPRLDPRTRIADMMSRRAMTFTRLLNLHATTRGRRVDKINARQAEAEARKTVAALEAEGRGLVAR